jgi:iron complex outermembrane receptor protein
LAALASEGAIQWAFAQTNTSAETDIVIVTGTRGGAHSLIESPVPVDVLSGEDLRNASAVAGE